MIRPIARQSLSAPAAALTRTAVATPRAPAASRASSSFPIADPSFWRSMVPKPFRRTPSQFAKKKKSKIVAFREWIARDWNPATFFIVIFLFIGSMSINMIALRKRFETFTRQSDVRIGLLREVVEKLQRGEKVDVEKVLGTGIPEREAEWEQVLNDLEKEDVARSQKKKQPEPTPSPKTAPALKAEESPKTTSGEPTIEATSRDFF